MSSLDISFSSLTTVDKQISQNHPWEPVACSSAKSLCYRPRPKGLPNGFPSALPFVIDYEYILQVTSDFAQPYQHKTLETKICDFQIYTLN